MEYWSDGFGGIKRKIFCRFYHTILQYSVTPSLHLNGINQGLQKDLQFQWVEEIPRRYYIVMITFQTVAGKRSLHFLSIFIMVLKVRCRKVQLMMTLFQG